MTERTDFVSEEEMASWKQYDRKAIAPLMAKLAKLESRETELLSQLTPIRAEKEKTEYWISLLKGEEVAEMTEMTEFHSVAGERVNGYVEPEANNADNELVCGNATLSDLVGCPSQRKAMYIVAEKNGGIIELNAAAALVVAAGMSKTDVRTVSATLHNFMSNHNDFEWIGPSRFRLSPDDEHELTTGDEMARVERNGTRVRI